MDQPDPNNPDDPRYYRKYAMNVPPPDLYYFVPDRKDVVALDVKSQNDRRVYFCWNNITEYERNGMAALKSSMAARDIVMPPSFQERDWLKWI